MIHDQLSLAKGNLSQEDLLLHRKQLETQYNFHGNIGIRYTFGSGNRGRERESDKPATHLQGLQQAM